MSNATKSQRFVDFKSNCSNGGNKIDHFVKSKQSGIYYPPPTQTAVGRKYEQRGQNVKRGVQVEPHLTQDDSIGKTGISNQTGLPGLLLVILSVNIQCKLSLYVIVVVLFWLQYIM